MNNVLFICLSFEFLPQRHGLRPKDGLSLLPEKLSILRKPPAESPDLPFWGNRKPAFTANMQPFCNAQDHRPISLTKAKVHRFVVHKVVNSMLFQ